MKTRSVLGVLIFVTASLSAQPCEIKQSSDLFAPFATPESAGGREWRASIRAAHRLMRACPEGPADGESRRLFHQYIDKQFSLDYDGLQAIWKQQGEPLSEGGVEAVRYFRAELRSYLDRMVDPSRDREAVPLLLRHANGVAIAKFGREVQEAVVAMAKSNRPARFWAERDDQIVAVDAIGEWLASSTYDAAEKRALTAVVLSTLPPNEVRGGREQALTLAALRALAHSSDPRVQQQLIELANRHANGANDDVATAAKDAVNAIARRTAIRQ